MISPPKRVSDRLRVTISRFQRVLRAARDRDVNESDTVLIVTDMLADVFGFDKYAEITSELAIRGTYCDLAVRIDDVVNYLIEVKAIGLGLKQSQPPAGHRLWCQPRRSLGRAHERASVGDPPCAIRAPNRP